MAGIGIAKKGLGLLGKKKKSWQDRRIEAINRKIKKGGGKPDISEYFAQEASDIYTSKAKTKKEYKAGK
jgi:hypothetical protein